MNAANPKASDTIAVLYPFDRITMQRTGSHPGKSFSQSGVVAFDQRHKWFQAESLTLSGVTEMHKALLTLAADGKAFIVRGQRAHAGTFCRRTRQADGSCPAGVKGADLHLLALDCDKWPNLGGFDPRIQSEEAFRWMLDVLGSEFADLTVSAAWSSSCCVNTPGWLSPETLSARFYVWCDTALNEAAARDLLKRLSLRVKAFYEPEGFTWSARQHPVDPKVADIQQPIYLAAPVFLDGLEDPLPGIRHVLLRGKRKALGYHALLKALPPLTHQRAPKAAPAAAIKVLRLPKARSLTVTVPGQVVPFAAATREIASMRAACKAAISGDDAAYRQECDNLYHRRVALEMLALAAHRGGLQEGERNNSSLMIASAIVAALPLTMTTQQVRAAVREMLQLVVDAAWIDAEWQGGGDMSVVKRYEHAVRGETGLNGGDPRYTYFKPRLLEEWQPTMAEVTDLGLMSLVTNQQRCAARSLPARVAAAEKSEALSRQAQQLRDGGMAQREIAIEMKVPRTTLRRLLAVEVAGPTVVAEHKGIVSNDTLAVASADVSPDAVIGMVAMLLTRGEDYVDAMAFQLGLTERQVRVALATIGQPELRRAA